MYRKVFQLQTIIFYANIGNGFLSIFTQRLKFRGFFMGAQIQAIRNEETNNDALITLYDFLGSSASFDAILTLALTLHRDYQIVISVTADQSSSNDGIMIYLHTKNVDQSFYEVMTQSKTYKKKIDFSGIEMEQYGMTQYYNVIQVIQKLIAEQ